MPTLTPEGRRTIEEIAARNGFSADAAIDVLFAMSVGHGSQAQFNHAELGGPGQWSKGGMLMIGDMFNHDLKARAAKLCSDLADVLANGEPLGAEKSTSQQQTQSGGRSPSAPLSNPDHSTGRWPEDLGQPTSVGSQNDLRYAVFPDQRRLAIDKGGQVTVYDTGDHRIGGVSQQQSGDQTLTFSSQHGSVRLSELQIVGADACDGTEAPAPTSNGQPTAEAAGTAAIAPGHDDIFAKLERLAELRDKGIVTDGEFDAKKAELLARL